MNGVAKPCMLVRTGLGGQRIAGGETLCYGFASSCAKTVAPAAALRCWYLVRALGEPI
jgi:hypothetical protein